MFEKEALIYATVSLHDGYTKIDYQKKKTDWQKGAEFGYNKANEWHYPSKGEYPKDDNDVLVLLKDETTQVDYYFPKIGWNISLKADVIAWKEIILPELPKESEQK